MGIVFGFQTKGVLLMQDVIKKLVEIDEQAKAFGEETKKQKEEYEIRIQEEAQKEYSKHMEDAEKEVERQKKIVESESEEKFKKNEAFRAEQIREIKRKFDENADKWVDEIVAEVLS